MNISQKKKTIYNFSNYRKIISKNNTVYARCVFNTFQTRHTLQVCFSNFPKRLFIEKINAAKPVVIKKEKVNFAALRNITQRLIKKMAKLEYGQYERNYNRKQIQKQIDIFNLVIETNKNLLREISDKKLGGNYKYNEKDFAYEYVPSVRMPRILTEKQKEALEKGRQQRLENLQKQRDKPVMDILQGKKSNFNSIREAFLQGIPD